MTLNAMNLSLSDAPLSLSLTIMNFGVFIAMIFPSLEFHLHLYYIMSSNESYNELD